MGFWGPSAGNTGRMDRDEQWRELAAALAAERDAEVRDEAHEVFLAEAARLRLLDRSGPVRLLLRCGQVVDGSLDAGCGPLIADHLTVHESGGRILYVASTAVVSVTGSQPGLRREREIAGRTVPGWLRDAWQADQWVAALTCDRRWVSGRPVRVGADHVDLAQNGEVVTVGLSAVEAWSQR